MLLTAARKYGMRAHFDPWERVRASLAAMAEGVSGVDSLLKRPMLVGKACALGRRVIGLSFAGGRAASTEGQMGGLEATNVGKGSRVSDVQETIVGMQNLYDSAGASCERRAAPVQR